MMERLFSGFLVSFASGVVKWNCWMKQQSNRHIQGHTQLSKLAVWVEQSLTALNRCGMLVFKLIIIWNVLKVMISTSK